MHWMNPTLCKLTKEIFDNPRWIFEPKYDGIRCLVFHDGKTIRLMSRNKNSLNAAFPEIVKYAQTLSSKEFVLDGEIVVGKGNADSFSRLQSRMGRRNPSPELLREAPCYLYVFDILSFDDEDLRRLTLKERKAILKSKIKSNARVRHTPVHRGTGKAYLHSMCAKHYEGAIGKDSESHYTGAREGSWKKFKCSKRQEFVICGYTAPQGSRQGLGALLLGYYLKGKLHYAGRVGTGFSDAMLDTLMTKLKRHRRETPPFSAGEAPRGNITWVAPTLVGEVAFTEWTKEGRLRHPSFLGLRPDKKAKQVVRE